jgi:hypothetical protein
MNREYGIKSFTLVLACGALAALTACGDRSILGIRSFPELVECPTSVIRTSTTTVDVLGGTVSIDGSSVAIPPGAVSQPTVILLTIPTSNFMEIEVRANGLETFTFQRDVSITIGYSRCTNPDIDRTPLQAWRINTSTKSLLENMRGTDNKQARTVTFSTGHLSGYAIAQ